MDIQVLKCDLCGTAKTVADWDMPKGWVVVVLENPYVDRDFYDRHVCDSCAKQIVLKAGKAAQ